MQRSAYLLLCFALLALGIFPASAQGGSIAAVIENSSEYTILQQFIDGSNDIEDMLRSGGNITFLAPTDRAFRNLENAVGLRLSSILGNVEIVTALMQYHIIDGTLSANQLRARNGQVIPTQLQNAFVGISTSSDNTIVVNNVVEITRENIRATNGIIHEINDVLLNRVINDLLDERLRSVPTATPTAIATATPLPTATPVPATRASASIRVAHFAPDAPDFQITIEDDVLFDDLSFDTVTDFMTVSQGIYTVIFASLDDDTTFVLDVDLTVLNGDFVSVAITGSADDELELVAITNQVSNLDDDEARIVFLNTLDNTASLSLALDSERIFEGVSPGEREQLDLEATDGTLSIAETRNPDVTLFEQENISFAAQNLVWVAIYGTQDDPQVSIVASSPEDLGNTSAGEPPETQVAVTPTPVDPATGSIISVLDDQAGFSILIEAINNADEEFLNLLGNPDGDPVTLLAPSDQAFINLLSTTGYSRSRLLSNTSLLDDILQYHVIGGILSLDDFLDASGTSITTIMVPPQAFFVRASDDGRVFLNGSIEFERTDIQASNGVIHVVDDVLLPLNVLEELDL